MTHYMLSMYQPGLEGETPPPEVLEPIMREIGEVNQAMRDSGAWVFGGGFHAPNTATVVRSGNGETFTTDGPYLEGKEHVGGFTVIQAEDLDAALEWGRKLTAASTLPVEVRPLQEGTCG